MPLSVIIEARDQREQRRLAGAVGAEEYHQLAGPKGKGDVLEHWLAAIAEAKVAHIQCRW